ncbi:MULTISPECIES: AAA-like domain-containing protein [unclassified Leptolyngbya]|uniref:AAA-like domain-containing protein n=1 Tax=unclassified Leptolyngbya TaxID=2650499 RepID=UPI001686EC30|nr:MULTISPECIES: AAA-like domain-containing protein [unclassified Leptolyngbya]MBD1913650.1 AAA-like domain-containing protein [Leptolyngbya sp. FACHB-8]MBD2158248.1 AAA-like domain-containing protein [Leptolyngbya sp. FACHB-16]
MSFSSNQFTTSTQAPKRRRRRGVVLTPQGFQKVQQAKTDAEFADNFGNRYTLEALSERTGLAVDTLMKVMACESGVDKQTLKILFRAFNLTLEPVDFTLPQVSVEEMNDGGEPDDAPELPGGQVPLDSSFYIQRATTETECYKVVLQPGGLIRIKAPRRMGKTSLMSRILAQVSQRGCQTVSLSFQLADKAIFQNLDQFLQWFCANVGLGLQLPRRIDDYWDDLFGSKISCKIYFEQYLLPGAEKPLVLALDDVDRLFDYPDLADEFFGLLRTWHEEAKNRDIWKQLRMIVAHSTEVYIPLNVNQSPFNVGLPVELKAFTLEQIQDLVQRHGLDWPLEQTQQLMNLVGGSPYLIQTALYHIWHQDVTLAELLDPKTIPVGIYSEHLQRQHWALQQNPDLAAVFSKVVTASEPIPIELVQGFKLQSLGLVQMQGNLARSSCNLYAQYFRDRLQGSTL